LGFANAASAQSLAGMSLYLGAGAGHTVARPDVGDYSDLRPGATTNAGTDDDTAWRAYGGVQFTRNWGLEVSYSQLGKYMVNYAIPPGGVAASTNKLTAWSVAGVGTWPLTDALSLHAIVGLSFIRTEYTFTGNGVGYPASMTGSAQAINPLIGAGANYDITKHIAVRIDYQSFGKVGQATANLTNLNTTGHAHPALASAGLEVKF